MTAREARLLAERDNAAAIAFPVQLTAARDDASATTAVAGEEKLFESRRTARTGQRAQLRERITQTNEDIRGLSAQLEAKGSELELIAKELVGVADLYRKNLARAGNIGDELAPFALQPRLVTLELREARNGHAEISDAVRLAGRIEIAFRTLAQCASSLTESACDLLLERLEQVLQRRALVGLDEDLDGHARNEADSLEAYHLLRRKRDADRV